MWLGAEVDDQSMVNWDDGHVAPMLTYDWIFRGQFYTGCLVWDTWSPGREGQIERCETTFGVMCVTEIVASAGE